MSVLDAYSLETRGIAINAWIFVMEPWDASHPIDDG